MFFVMVSAEKCQGDIFCYHRFNSQIGGLKHFLCIVYGCNMKRFADLLNALFIFSFV